MAKARYKIVYEGKDITRDLEGEVGGLIYRDKTVGECDELSIDINDKKHLWKAAYNPQKGDRVEAEIITDAGTLVCGSFTVDDLHFYGNKDGGHRLHLQALAAGVKDPVRTKSSFAHEGKTLKAIAEKIADKYNYRVQGIVHDHSIARVTQFHESDLAFLHRIAEEFGYMFNLKGNVLVFTYLPELNEQMGSGIVVNFADRLGNYDIRDKVAGIYVRGQNRYHNSKQKKLYDSLVAAGTNPSKDVLKSVDHVDGDQQGLYKVDGRLYKKNLDQVEIAVSVPGNVLLVAGVNVTAEGWYNYDGKYFLSSSVHVVNNELDYETSVVLKKIVPNEKTGNAKGQTVGY